MWGNIWLTKLMLFLCMTSWIYIYFLVCFNAPDFGSPATRLDGIVLMDDPRVHYTRHFLSFLICFIFVGSTTICVIIFVTNTFSAKKTNALGLSSPTHSVQKLI